MPPPANDVLGLIQKPKREYVEIDRLSLVIDPPLVSEREWLYTRDRAGFRRAIVNSVIDQIMPYITAKILPQIEAIVDRSIPNTEEREFRCLLAALSRSSPSPSSTSPAP